MSARFCHARPTLRWWEGHVIICGRGSVTSLPRPLPVPGGKAEKFCFSGKANTS